MERELKWREPKDPSDEDYYEVEVRSAWVSGDPLSSVTFEAKDTSGLNISPVVIKDNLARAFITGGIPGEHSIEINVTTVSGRKKQRTAKLVVKEM
jgi:hypothetical protein